MFVPLAKEDAVSDAGATGGGGGGGAKAWHVDVTALALCALMTLGLYYGGLVPLMRERDATLARRDQLEAHRGNASHLAASVARARGQLQSVREGIDQTPLKLQPSRLVNSRLAELTDLANAQGLQIEHIEPAQARTAGRYEIVPLRMAGVGRFPTCVAFLHKLREEFPDTGIAGFELSGNPAVPGTGRFEMELHWFATPSRVNDVRADVR
jgi:hypothetical protein